MREKEFLRVYAADPVIEALATISPIDPNRRYAPDRLLRQQTQFRCTVQNYILTGESSFIKFDRTRIVDLFDRRKRMVFVLAQLQKTPLINPELFIEERLLSLLDNLQSRVAGRFFFIMVVSREAFDDVSKKNSQGLRVLEPLDVIRIPHTIWNIAHTIPKGLAERKQDYSLTADDIAFLQKLAYADIYSGCEALGYFPHNLKTLLVNHLKSLFPRKVASSLKIIPFDHPSGEIYRTFRHH